MSSILATTPQVKPFRLSAPQRQRNVRSVIAASSEQQASSSEPTCPTCGVPKSQMAGGCNGEGRIIGGLGAIPGFGWWPIKAYRPCGVASSKGIRYQRAGQGLDELKGVQAPRLDEIIRNTQEEKKE